ncbi:hypothetical protein [Photorhabdus bodei]|uniref:Uncharacterized protein n=1 Tax=Photorhabdus bodei TaxID=2029681 RepID=A0ABX0AUQ5_9GAMM|nr:hypothetical protein [Photorhabdus bodei]NDL01175.1 hypothetical protein [Photorhabdus bodei]NDL05467.1 hypothetical protein [Photorhabdus bodei]NDL09689.1 hypothetical protein [Photorhabdus bodei]
MDKEFRKLILASSGNSFTLYLEMIISFTLITYHWNGGAIYTLWISRCIATARE